MTEGVWDLLCGFSNDFMACDLIGTLSIRSRLQYFLHLRVLLLVELVEEGKAGTSAQALMRDAPDLIELI